MKKLLLIASFLVAASASCCYAQVTTYTLTPYSNSVPSLISIALTSSSGMTVDYPVNEIYPQFSRDSIKVQFLNIQDRAMQVMSVPDSISHFFSGAHRFGTKDVKGLDSFFHCCMTR